MIMLISITMFLSLFSMKHLERIDVLKVIITIDLVAKFHFSMADSST